MVIGNHVPEVYKEIVRITNGREDSAPGGSRQEKGNLAGRLVDIVSSIFTPLLGVMAGGGVSKINYRPPRIKSYMSSLWH